MNARRAAVAIGVPVVFGFASFAVASIDSFAKTYMVRSSATVPGIMVGWITMGVGAAVGFAAGGPAAALFGPNAAAGLGLAVGAAGLALAALAPGEAALWIGYGLGTAGPAFAATGLWTSAAATFPRPDGARRAAILFLTYAGVQVGVSAANFAREATRQSTDPDAAAFALAAVAAGMGAIAAGGTGLAQVVLPDAQTDLGQTGRGGFDGRLLGLALVAGLFALTPWVTSEYLRDELFVPFSMARSGTWWPYFLDVYGMPLVGAITACAGAAVAALASRWGPDIPALVPAGLAFVAVAIVGAVTPWIIPRESLGFAVATLLIVVARAIAWPLVLSVILGDLHWRLACLAAAAWLVGSDLAASLLQAGVIFLTMTDPVDLEYAGVASAACGLGGLVLLGFAVPHRWMVAAILEPPPAGDVTPVRHDADEAPWTPGKEDPS